MIRQITINLNYANTGKKQLLLIFLQQYTTAVNGYIDLLWEQKQFSGSFLNREQLDSIKTKLEVEK